jgi:hypothetical protein
MPVDTSTAMAEAKPIMAARPSHTPAPAPAPACFAPCSHRTEEETRLLLGAARGARAVEEHVLRWMEDGSRDDDSAAGEAARTEKSAMTRPRARFLLLPLRVIPTNRSISSSSGFLFAESS